MTVKTLIPRREFLGASGVLTGLIAAGTPLDTPGAQSRVGRRIEGADQR